MLSRVDILLVSSNLIFIFESLMGVVLSSSRAEKLVSSEFFFKGLESGLWVASSNDKRLMHRSG